MSVEIELVGGPHDGRRTRIDGDPLDPPESIHTADLPRSIDPTRSDNPAEPMIKLAYWRTSHADHVWRYQYRKPKP
ncbi:hypothetical protein [Streptomyces sp. enrichment culture]|uniref:hypothetical protein n=1 Tax=Streptomyces sp. enrichment culture TaxID=1795815 RepID=UPI003F57D7B8